jgi:hypothetical protein
VNILGAGNQRGEGRTLGRGQSKGGKSDPGIVKGRAA